MSRDIWNPGQYRAYSSHRARPFFDLLSRVDADAPAYVVDLGCGPGERTLDLATRWPDAVIEGIDSSAQMITEARRLIENPRARDRTSAQMLSGAAGPPGGTPAGGATAGGTAREAAPGAGRPAGEPPSPGEAVGGRTPDDQGTAQVVSGPGRLAGEPSVPGEAAAGGAAVHEAAVGEEARAGGTGAGEAGRPGTGLSAGEAVRGEGPLPSDDAAVGAAGGTVRFSVGDLAEWTPDRPVDVIFSNAALQWVPEHRELLPKWVRALTPRGRLAFSMPGNFEGPSHRILRELCESPRWRDRLSGVNRHNVVGDPAEYFELLSDLGCEVNAWETTYLQVLQGPDPVLEWMKGTALRPALDALPNENEREKFLTELADLLREAYPPGRHGTLFPFRRVFVVAGPPTPAA